MEPHADFLAGWILAKNGSRLIPTGASPFATALLHELNNETAVKAIFSKGDTSYYDINHHGEPELRAAMMLAGLDARNLEIKEAFEKGERMSGIPQLPLFDRMSNDVSKQIR